MVTRRRPDERGVVVRVAFHKVSLAMAVVVVSLNTRDILQKCLESVLAAAPAEMVVVDNRSTDGSPDLVRALFPSVRLIASDTNLGYGGADVWITVAQAATVI